jgi:excisionase family DNA binding protein
MVFIEFGLNSAIWRVDSENLTSGRGQYDHCFLRIQEVTPMREHFTVNELARHFNVNPKTIYRRLWAKGIPAYKVGRIWRIARKDIISLKR